jgi:hypothetical protein
VSWGLLLAATALAGAAAFWHASLGAREIANQVAMDTCRKAGVQMLDGTVSIHRLGLVRDGGGPLTLRRTYLFDYTEDGYSRRRGFVVLSGASVESIGLGPRPVA